MMSSMTCMKCGAEMAAGARFCRRCGEPAPAHAPAQSVLEAETRIFATEAEPSASTQHINAHMTGPAYMSPAEMHAPQAPVTKSLQSSSSTFKVLMLGVVLVLLVVPVVLLLIMFVSNWSSRRAETPVVTVPEIPPPPAPPSGSNGTASSSALVYPDAKVLLDITKSDGHVLQLRTNDSIDKVVRWYTDKIKPSETVKVPGGNMTILRGTDIRAVITSTGAGTDIIIKQGGEDE